MSLSAKEIRQQFFDFFLSKGHAIVPSAPIVVKNDPSLLFTNAGMNPFKDYFLGHREAKYLRVADTQKCLRVSGKHNDLEEVGVDTYHHTMFEMLGNWSFGDYFKAEAIAWSWELLTEVYKIDPQQIYVTIFEGDTSLGVEKDLESLEAWKKYLPEDRILTGTAKDNFWEMGDTGPCGPCTEIHLDCREPAERAQVSGADLVNRDHPQVIEIWNLVFMQFNRQKDGQLKPLPARHVDTGMGLERLVRVLQGKQSNYDTDLFQPYIREISRITGIPYLGGDRPQDIAFRVISDHIRALCFTIADGQLPSNTGAGYVIRRILRRATRYYYTYLDWKQPLLHQLVPLLASAFDDVFPELQKQQDMIARVIAEEEESFLKTLDRGLRRLDEIIRKTRQNQKLQIPGDEAFELYDTYGFPLDLTQLIAGEQQLGVDESGFQEEMKKQKDRSRKATALDADDWISVHEGKEEFVGYQALSVPARIRRYRRVVQQKKETFQLVLSQTPFYPEGGGQVGDRGKLVFEDETLEVLDTKKENDLILHFVSRLPKDPTQPLLAEVDLSRRRQAEIHHTATHLLHAALREVLGDQVQQKGSLVDPDYLRFDFSHFSKMTPEQIREVEERVQQKIQEDLPVQIRTMAREDALELGAMALFGEKYAEEVRVVIIDESFSIELCGGTHVRRTSQLGLFTLISEGSVAAGIRRVEALAGDAALKHLRSLVLQHEQLVHRLRNPKDPVAALDKLLKEKADTEKMLEELESAQYASMARQLVSQVEKTQDVPLIAQVLDGVTGEGLKRIYAQIKDRLPRHLVLLGSNNQGKAQLLLGISEDLARDKNWDAAKIMKTSLSPRIQGGGGGQAHLATAGGKNAQVLPDLMDWIRSLAEGKAVHG